jgi:hypothetical protein
VIPKHHRLVVPAVTLVVAAIAVPAASAQVIRPNPDEAGLIAPQHATSQAVVRPNPDEVGLIAASRPTPQTSQAVVRPNPDEVGSGPGSLSTEQLTALTRPEVVHVESKPGFDWGDAGIGAGIALGVAMVGLGAVLGRSGRRRDRAPAV